MATPGQALATAEQDGERASAASVSTHWSGWFALYPQCKVGGQMHWGYLQDGRRQVERHYFRFRKQASTLAGYDYQWVGRASWYTMDVAYRMPGPGPNDRYRIRYDPAVVASPCPLDGVSGFDHRYRDRRFAALGPSTTHEVVVRCRPNTSCGDIKYWRRIGIGGPGNSAGYWKTLAHESQPM
jgi:hypothetical protein